MGGIRNSNNALHALAVDAPEMLQVLGLRLLCSMWKRHGRGWSRLSVTLLGYTPPSTRPSELLRVTRAASICDVCEHDCNRGVELVKAIQVQAILLLPLSHALLPF